MNRHRLLGIRCALVALALALAPAAPPARAQLPLPVDNLAPVVNAGLDQVITLPSSANLTGVAIDDGLPIPPVLTTTWSQVSGPGTVSFSNPSALISTATFSASGPYVLRLTASDGALAASDDVAVTVNPAPPVNLAPVVNAGADQVITLPGSANLTGVAIDDGLPIPPVLTTTWSQVSGPGTVSFSNPSALISTATFSASGPYVLRLTASDGALAASDDVAVTVNPESLIEDKIDPALLALMAADRQKLLPVIVEMQQPLPPFVGAPNIDRALEALDLLRVFGIPVAGLSLIDGAAGFANAAGIEAMSLAPTVAFIHHDATVGPRRSAEPPVVTPPDQFSEVYPQVVNADQGWLRGITGNGVTVAVLDSGVAADADLIEPENRILASVNFADQRLASDPGGHGTHIAGIIAGNGSRSGGEFIGIAPQANIVDVRVLGNTGSGRISSVVRGIEWVLAHRAVYNIRVINLSFGAPASLSYRADPMSAAVEIAWRRGLVVVAASGNGGPERDTVVTPGIDPYAITVGATDDRGTNSRRDDALAWFSAWGSADSNAKPDLVAPGRRLVSLRVPGSTLDTLFPDRVVAAQNGSTYFRLTGTSMATGVVSGAAALLLEHRPDLTPNQVKALLVGTTQPYGEDCGEALPDPIADGSGLLDVFAAAREAAPNCALQPVNGLACANNALRPADGFARALYPVLYGSPLHWKDPTLGGIDWQALTWDSVAWDSVAWDNFDWDSVAWDSVAWDSVAWDSVAWDSVAWDSVAWDSVAWDSFTLD
jgi:serine protease AprX